jgi:hypothetical protein
MIWLKAIAIAALLWACIVTLAYGVWKLWDWGVPHIGWWFPAATFVAFGFIASVIWTRNEWDG